MIYLITGSPGTGKTSRVVSMILSNEEGLFKTTLDDGTLVDRPLYFCHIDGLDVKKFKAHELSEQDLQSAPLRDLVPQGAIVIVDEADYTYPVRSAGRPVPAYIQTLKELRHEGFTLILMTQHPSMIDIYIRNLVGKHIHLDRKPMGTKEYIFYRCQTSLDNPALMANVQSKWYKPDKKAFNYYKSATVHIKFKKNVPKLVWVFVFLLCFFAYKAYTVYGIYDASTGGQVVDSSEASIVAEASGVDSDGSPLAHDSKKPSVVGSDPSDYVPALSERVETKPIYDDLRVVKSMEYPVACIQSASKCACYTDQATPIPELPEALCRYWILNGRQYNPYKEPVKEPVIEADFGRGVVDGKQQPEPAASNVMSLGGKAPSSLMYDDFSKGRLN